MSQDDRVTPPDPHRPARGPSRPDVEPSDADAERLKREAVSALRRVGADRARLPERRETPRGLPRPPVDTLHDGAPPPSDARPPRSQSPAEGQAAVLLDELAKARGKIAELERDKRAAAEVKVASFPPPVQPRSQSPVPSSDQKRDQAIGAVVRTLAVRVAARLGWTPLLVALGLGAGGAGVLKPSADPGKQDATVARVAELERRAERAEKRATVADDYARELARVSRCLRAQQARVNEAVAPAPDRMGSARKPEAWDDLCPPDPRPP